MAVIDTSRRIDLEELTRNLRVAARTIRAATLAERDATRLGLVGAVDRNLEPHARLDEPGLEALRVWEGALAAADPNDVDLLQELLYGLDALVRVHIWRETGLPLQPPQARSASDV